MRRLVILLSVLAIAPLLHPLYFWGAHDGRHSVYFLVEFDRSIRDGIFWPRWAPDFAYGYGYPIFNIYAPLAYYIGEALHLAGMDFVLAVKTVFALSFVLSGLAMYWFARDLIGARGGLVAAVVYMYVPYRLVDVYVRGALSESLAFVFFPLVLGSFRRLLGAVEMREYAGSAVPSPMRMAILASLSLAGLILTHNGLAVLFLPVVALYIAWHLLRLIWNILKERRAGLVEDLGMRPLTVVLSAWWCLGAAVFALTLSAVFWVPLGAEYNDVRTDQWTTADYDFRSHFVYPNQLVSPFWGYGISKEGPDDTMPFQLGVAPLALALVGLFGVRRAGVTADRIFFAALAVVSVFFITPASAPIWEALKSMSSLVQFPWRLLALTALALAYLAGLAAGDGGGAERSSDARDRVGLAALLLVVLLSSYPLLNPPMIEPPEGPVSLGALMRFEQSSGELVGLTRWNKVKPNDSPLKPLYEADQPILSKVNPETVPDGAIAETVRRSSVMEEVHITTPTGFTIGIYSQFYPGWKATIDGAPVEIVPAGDLGLMTIAIPAGDHTLMLNFVDTPPRTIGEILTGLSVLALVAYWTKRWWRRYLPARAGRTAEMERVA